MTAIPRAGTRRDFKNFVSFMKALTERMHGGDQKRLVSLTLPASYWYLQHFGIKNLEKHVDWFNMMSYDVHGSWDIDSKSMPSVANSHSNMTELQEALDLLWRNDVDPKKVTFGSLGVGCNIKHQTACCTNVAATAAYGECKWVGTASSCNPDCPSDFPTKMVSTKRGTGGEQPCIIGQKSYCCRDPKPAAFATCDWYKKEALAKFAQDFICEDACPKGQIKLATEAGGPDRTGGCFGGARAFCCEPAKPKVVPRQDDDPFGGKQNKEFQLLLEKYMENPTCPATLLHPSPGSIFQDKLETRAVALDLEMEASEFRVLQGRAKDCDVDRFTRLIQYAALMLTMADSMLEPLSRVYDELFANSYDVVLRAAGLRRHYNRFSHLDPKNFMTYLFLNPTQAGHIVRRQALTDEVFCEPGSRTRARRETTGDVAKRPRSDVSGSAGCSAASLSLSLLFPRYQKTDTTIEKVSNLAPRWVWWQLDSGDDASGGHPSITDILEGIEGGDLSLHYARWLWTPTQGGPTLELAYWIGPVPGVAGGDDRYRDLHRQADGGGRDRWVVFHLHIDVDNTEWLRRINDRTYVGVASIQVMHAQAWTDNSQEEGDWRVNVRLRRGGTQGRTARDGFDCQGTHVWYVGSAPSESLPPQADDPNDARYVRLLREWGRTLFEDEFVSSAAVELITEVRPKRIRLSALFPPPSTLFFLLVTLTGDWLPKGFTLYPNGDIHPESSYRLLSNQDVHHGWRANMYRVNWSRGPYGFVWDPPQPQ
ncbi:hypothetical protein PG984_007013 [Apiospora sp. TS-2023a]